MAVRPASDIAGARAAHARLAATVAGISDADTRRPSRLPAWTVGHVLTHLARNADSHVRMLEAAARGEVADQYPGGLAQRAADIESGAGRPAAALALDVAEAAQRLEAAWDALPEEAWEHGRGRVTTGVWSVAQLPFFRWREVEVHHTDLGLGYGFSDWQDDYVDLELARAVSELPARLPEGTALLLDPTDATSSWRVPEHAPSPTRVAAERRRLLAWLMGRVHEPTFPDLAPWQREHRRG